MSNTEIINSEILEEINKGKGCIIFDFGCYFPYKNDLIFDFSLGMEEMTDKKLNHRYPNKGYHTISKKYGKRVSKIGYPYFFELEETNPDATPWILTLTVGVDSKEQTVQLLFPLLLNVTKEKPVCTLSLRYIFEKQRFTFTSHYPSDDGIGFLSRYWTNNEEFEFDDSVQFEIPEIIEDCPVILYPNVITPVACEIGKIMI